jgi:hypothetical protein
VQWNGRRDVPYDIDLLGDGQDVHKGRHNLGLDECDNARALCAQCLRTIGVQPEKP